MPETQPLILIVDDEDGLRFLLQNRLEKRGYRVDFAPNGQVAFDKICSDSPPDMVVTDMKMPGMDGITVLEKVRQLTTPVQPMPFIMMTGFPEKKQIDLAQTLGVLEIFIKPFSYTGLVKKIDDFFLLQKQSKTPAAS